MSNIGVPIHIPELNLSPEQEGGILLSDSMQQVLSFLTGFWQNKRVLLKASPAGILLTASPQITGIFHVTATGTNYTYVGSNIPCSEVMIMAHPDNTGRVWVTNNITATVNNAIPLDNNDSIVIGLTNLNMLNLLIAVNGEKAIISYSI